MKLFRMIYHSNGKEISVNPTWVCSYSCYLHTNDSLLGLLWSVITEYKNDKHLVG